MVIRRARLLALVAVAVALLAACEPPPATDADNATAGANRYGWFEADRAWRGDFGDPHVVNVNGTYYAYSSPTGGRYLPVMTSTDLVTWRAHPRWTTARAPWAGGPNPNGDTAIPAEIRASSMSPGDTWNMNDGLVATASWALPHPQGPWIQRDYWAPGVIQIGDTWYAYSAVRVSWASDDPNGFGRFCITVASAPSPLGPFRDVSGGGPIVCDSDPAGSIDPAPYFDPVTGANYLLWKSAGKVRAWPSALRAQRLGADGRPDPASRPVTLLTTNEGSWEGSTIENPSMVRWNGTTYLFYSGNFFGADANGSSRYATGYAVCPQGPLGPCTRPSPGPLLSSDGDQNGPGGASAFLDTAGQLRLAYASYWPGENRPDTFIPHPRRLSVVRLVRDAGGLLRVG